MNLSRLPSNGPVLSVVIPVFNEKPVLPRLYERLHKALDSLDFQYEIVFVDDGSTDDSHRYLAGLAYTYPWVRLVKLRACELFGHARRRGREWVCDRCGGQMICSA